MNIARTVHIAACIWPTEELKSRELLHEWWEKCKVASSSSTVRRRSLQFGLWSCNALMKWLMMTNVQRRYTRWNCKRCEKMIVSHESTSCLFATRPTHLYEEVSWRKIQARVLESDSEAFSEDHDLVLHGSKWSWSLSMKLSMRPNASVYCWSDWCYQHSSIPVPVLFEAWQWTMSSGAGASIPPESMKHSPQKSSDFPPKVIRFPPTTTTNMIDDWLTVDKTQTRKHNFTVQFLHS